MRVLHVADCYAGGVSRAIETIAGLLPEHEHFLAFDGEESPTASSGFAGAEQLRGGKCAKVIQLSRVARKYMPDVIHAHSSWAGMFARIIPMPAPVVYQPHCFVFDDPYRGRASKAVFRVAERILSRSSKVVLTLTNHEVRLAKSAGLKGQLVNLPNVPTIADSLHAPTERTDSIPFTVSMVGRLARQKDPLFFAEVADALRNDQRFKFVWIGDGDLDYRRRLEGLGVRVTGWLGPDRLFDELKSSSVYLHSAAYEGYPLSVLDAAALGCAIIVRKIPAFEDDQFLAVDRTGDAVQLLLGLAEDPAQIAGLRRANSELLARMNRAEQRKVLLNTYRSLVE